MSSLAIFAATYDKMSNIQTLNRSGAGAAVLTYSYTGNQLTTVTNGGSTFRTYSYDGNGNATTDGTTKNIAYNILNLPQSVNQSGTTLATYTYEASGTKIRNTGSDGTWDYVSGIVYHNGTISFISTEEGRAIPNGASYSYQYNLKDHLGNERVSMDKNGVLQEDEYYAFGLRNPKYDNSNNNRYLYNGKEIQTDLANQYDYGARFYDPMIARWTTIDPKAELGRRETPYGYAFDDPMRFTDPDGMWPWDGLVDKAKKVISTAVTEAKKELSKYTIKSEFKTTLGVQAGVEVGHGFEVKLAPLAVVVSKDNMTIKNGKLTEQTGTLLNQTVDKKTGKVTNNGSVETESKIEVEVLKSGGEAGLTQRVDGQMRQSEAVGYVKGSLGGMETKKEYLDQNKEKTTKSYEVSFGAQFFAGFEYTLNIQKTSN